ncbi:MAG: TetR/AcrR family transcriptional regulator [Chloroflexi bacterium]|nr:TetR/AcrR family transcriptional regulator [Chloroflexota bacterium]
MLSNPNEEEKLDPRIKRTRILILQAFESLLAEKGFESISVQDIATKADINRGTFYLHFPDKHALLDYSVAHLFRQEIEKRTLNACHYTPENLKNLILVVCEFHGHIHGGCAQPHEQFESLTERTIKSILFELLSYWLKQTGTKIQTDLPATVATWSIYGLASYYGHLKKRPALDKFVDEALPLVAVNLEQFA